MTRVRTAISWLVGLGLLAACGPAAPSGDIAIGFWATNPTHVSRPGEYVSLSLDIPTEAMAGAEGKTPLVFRVVNGQSEEVPSQVLEFGPAGQEANPASHLAMIFQDGFAPGETKSYELRFGEASTLSLSAIEVEDLGTEGIGDRFLVRTGAYDFAIGHELERLDYGWGGALMKDLYVRLEGAEQWARLMPLSHIYFNTPEHRTEWLQYEQCEPLFLISAGLPPVVAIHGGPLVASITLGYSGQIQAACPPYEVGFDPPQPTGLYRAEVVLTFYRDLPRVDTRTEVVLAEGFYNHSGFSLGGVETELARPRVLFGVPEHTVLQGALWADTSEASDRTEFMQVEGGQFVFRRASTRDAGAPFAVLSRSDTFNDYYVVEGLNGRGSFVYFPDFERLAYQNTRNEGLETIPVNMVGAGPSVPLVVANPIILSQTHLGNVGDVWAPIAPGTYIYRLTGLLDVPFDPDGGEAYDAVAQALASPIAVSLAENALSVAASTATATIAAPASSTPPPTATPTPTPVPATCAPPRHPIPAQPLPEGSILPLLADRLTTFEDDGALFLDNEGRAEYAGGQTNFFSVPGPFSLVIAFESPPGEYVLLNGRVLQATNWWDGEYLAFSGDTVTVFDGQARNAVASDWHYLRRANDGTPLRLHFLEPCGKNISISDPAGRVMLDLNLELPGEFTMFENGLFPDGVVSFALQVSPGSWIKVTELTVDFD